ncbi:MAG: hypothetical protein GY940_06575 [bacterium]|nr:hypothetical protein [bacterium]
MTVKWNGFRSYKKYWKYFLAAIVLLLSIKPALLTWHLAQSGRHHRVHQTEAGEHMTAVLRHRPSAYHAFKKYGPAAADRLLMKLLIDTKEFHWLTDASLTPVDLARIKAAFKNNLYLHRLFPGFIDTVRHPENPDPLSLELLADPAANGLSEEVFREYIPSLPDEFKANVAGFCRWKGNEELIKSWTWTIPDSLDSATEPPPMPLKPVETKNNLLNSPGFDSAEGFKTHWVFSNMAGSPPFADGSFTMGQQPLGQNKVLRIMGFFSGGQTPRTQSRAGAWYKKAVPVTKGYYVFSFDYATATGSESPSFYLWKKIREQKLPAIPGHWRNVIFVLDNTGGRHKWLKPLIRMWGTGSLWVDNVCLLKVTDPRFKMISRQELTIKPVTADAAE